MKLCGMWFDPDTLWDRHISMYFIGYLNSSILYEEPLNDIII